MKVVVIGGRGMLARSLLDACQSVGWEVAGYDLPELDITKMNGEEVEEADWVVNCAAYTRVDDAETDPLMAFAVNTIGAGKVAAMCARRGMKLLHVSTDYVFDGYRSVVPYTENDETNPLSVYGMSKLCGEMMVRSALPTALIVRTQSLFGIHGASFIKSILKQLKDGKKTLKVVDDQVSCPTNVKHLSAAMVKLMEKDIIGVVNVSSEGYCSWYEFAREIVNEIGYDGTAEVLPVKTGEFPVKAVRPTWSVLSKEYYKKVTGDKMPTWKEGLTEFLFDKKGEV